MKRFELVDISGDAGIEVFGRNMRELFENAAVGTYSLITDMEAVKEERVVNINIVRDSLDVLLVAWLNELIFRFDVEGFIAKKIVITDLSVTAAEDHRRDDRPLALKASLSGEDFDPARHEGKLLLKAATYHDLEIEKTGDIWRSKIIFDV